MNKHFTEQYDLLSSYFNYNKLQSPGYLLLLLVSFYINFKNNWSERSLCAMRRQTQWPLLTLLFLFSLSPVFTILPEGLFLGFWMLRANLYWPKKKKNEDEKFGWGAQKLIFFFKSKQLLGGSTIFVGIKKMLRQKNSAVGSQNKFGTQIFRVNKLLG